MPDQGMSVNFNVVLFTEGNQFIRRLKVVRIPARMDQCRFHDIFRRGHVELSNNEGRGFGVPFVDLGVVERRADAKILFEGFF